VALSLDETVLHRIHYDNGYSHAENLHPFIQRLMAESGIPLQSLSAVAVSKGPGSYTGLRIGVSAAKGLAYTLQIPVIALNTLQVMAEAAKEKNPDARFYCPMLDARRMEVYTAMFNHDMTVKLDTQALILTEESVAMYHDFSQLCFFGNGYAKAMHLLAGLKDVYFIDHINPEAAYMARAAYQKFLKKDFEDTVYFEPFYLKDFLIVRKTKA
jgi:tRNA threonylcarbamoyladenosine biosynthesis protein TsaB